MVILGPGLHAFKVGPCECGWVILLSTEVDGCELHLLPGASLCLLFAFKGGGGACPKVLTSLLIHRQPPSEHCRDPGLHQCPSSWEGGVMSCMLGSKLSRDKDFLLEC